MLVRVHILCISVYKFAFEEMKCLWVNGCTNRFSSGLADLESIRTSEQFLAVFMSCLFKILVRVLCWFGLICVQVSELYRALLIPLD